MELNGQFDGPMHAALPHKVFHGHPFLNTFAGEGKGLRIEVRETLQKIFADESNKEAMQEYLLPVEGVKMDMPVHPRDYTDFYSSYDHAYNVGVMIRGPDNAI
jgi:fumarylacetoacetase